LGVVYVQENGKSCSSLIIFSVNYNCGDGRCSFEIEHVFDFVKVMGMHKTRARKIADVIEGAKVLVFKKVGLHFHFGQENCSECVGGWRLDSQS